MGFHVSVREEVSGIGGELQGAGSRQGTSLDQWARKGNRVGLPFRAHCRTVESQRRAGGLIAELVQASWHQGEAASR